MDQRLEELSRTAPTVLRGRRFFRGGIALGVPTVALGALTAIMGFGVAIRECGMPDCSLATRHRRLFYASPAVILPMFATAQSLIIRGIRLKRGVLRPLRERRRDLLRERRRFR